MSARPNFAARALLIATLGVAASAASPTQSLPADAKPHPPSTLRIGLWTLWHDKQVSIAANPAATFRLCETCPASTLAHPIQIRASGNELVLPSKRLAGSVWLSGSLTLAAHGESLALRNPIRITAHNGELLLTVTLPVESYVERVVASEGDPADSPESLKALAIVVRSFALHQPHGHADYDLCDSTHCQLLHWPSHAFQTNPAAHAATLSTSGETLWFHGRRAQAWFHQNCGGRTASPQEVWPAKSRDSSSGSGPMPWLISRIDPYCTANGAREWSTNLSKADLTAALAAAGLARPGWNALSVSRRGESGRAVTLLVDSSPISAEDFRVAVGRSLGWGKILSTWFEISRQGDQFAFHGRGSGHGVGLCQAGAAVMSAQGRDATAILAQYFPGAEAADETTGRAWQTLLAQGFQLQTLDSTNSEYLPPLSQAIAQAESRSGLQPGAPITVRAYRSTSAFRDATLAPGWVAAFTEGNWIATQPLPTLAARKILVPTLRHEFLHALVESQASPKAPLWLREGLVEVWNGDAKPTAPPPSLKLDQVDSALTRAATESESDAAHCAAGWFAARLIDHYGRSQVLAWLRTAVPQSTLVALK
jgi:stage II sporulation protein D